MGLPSSRNCPSNVLTLIPSMLQFLIMYAKSALTDKGMRWKGDVSMHCCLNKDTSMLGCKGTVMMMPCRVDTWTCIVVGSANNWLGPKKATDTQSHVHECASHMLHTCIVHKQ